MSETIILKWPLESATSEIWMQPGPVIAVAWQHELPTLWIAHDLHAPKLLRSFEAIPTGTPIPGIGVHVGSAISDELVFHIFELTGFR
jgi:hypothetical protein